MDRWMNLDKVGIGWNAYLVFVSRVFNLDYTQILMEKHHIKHVWEKSSRNDQEIID